MTSHQHDENCKKMLAQLSEYLDLELSPDACKEMDAHMAGCEPCAAFTKPSQNHRLCREYQPPELPPIARNARQKLLEAYQNILAGRRS